MRDKSFLSNTGVWPPPWDQPLLSSLIQGCWVDTTSPMWHDRRMKIPRSSLPLVHLPTSIMQRHRNNCCWFFFFNFGGCTDSSETMVSVLFTMLKVLQGDVTYLVLYARHSSLLVTSLSVCITVQTLHACISKQAGAQAHAINNTKQHKITQNNKNNTKQNSNTTQTKTQTQHKRKHKRKRTSRTQRNTNLTNLKHNTNTKHTRTHLAQHPRVKSRLTQTCWGVKRGEQWQKCWDDKLQETHGVSSNKPIALSVSSRGRSSLNER